MVKLCSRWNRCSSFSIKCRMLQISDWVNRCFQTTCCPVTNLQTCLTIWLVKGQTIMIQKLKYQNLWFFGRMISLWRHQMVTVSALPALFVRGVHRLPVNSPHEGRWRGALMFSLISTRTVTWVNSGDAGDLRRHRAHYDVNVICLIFARTIFNVLDITLRLRINLWQCFK